MPRLLDESGFVCLRMNNRAHHIALNDAQNVLRIIQTEYTDARNLVLAADGDGGSVHDLEVTLLNLLIGHIRQQLCLRIDTRVAVIHAIHILCQQNGVRADFNRA